MLWEVDIHPAEGCTDLLAREVLGNATDLGLGDGLRVATAHGYLLQGQSLDLQQVQRLAAELLSDQIVQRTTIAPVGDDALVESPHGGATLIQVLPKPGVMDPVALSTQRAIAELGISVDSVRTIRKFWLHADGTSDSGAAELDPLRREQLCAKVLGNDAVEQVIVGPLPFDRLELGASFDFELVVVPLADLDDQALMHLSLQGQLYLSLAEMQTIQAHFRELGRDPTDAELETIAQTWSEHCSHKTLKGRIQYRDENGTRQFNNMLKETIFAATQEIRLRCGEDDWCVSVFEDNAGIVRFDEENNICFKVETHNHPSALEPYGGANTGIGGVIRDPVGTGMGTRPVCNTDVFCFAPPDTPAAELPKGVLHPKRVMKGVVSGVRDYGNRMGIPTVNGAIYFDPRYLGNPLVFCGTVGILPREMSFGKAEPGDLIVAVGGRTGRDGIHGATFSSAELTSQSEELSGGAVQIGNPITEKMFLDVILEARDAGLYHAITDCGAGGFSSAVGEMGETIGAEVWLERVPLKYDGLSYTEIWISEAQERMVLAVPESSWEALESLCRCEDVEATVIGRFVPTNRLQLKYEDQTVAELSMEFLHDGRPAVIRDAVYEPTSTMTPEASDAKPSGEGVDCQDALLRILGSLNVASKEWVIRQYDHEVQGGSVLKPLVGVANDGPGDASVVRPRLDSNRGIALSVGMNPHYGDLDTYHMAASAIDEAVRNCVAVGANPRRIAILDNFCWGNTQRPEQLGSLVRAALACHDVALVLETPFVSGKDSLNNEFRYTDADGQSNTIAIPPSLLISAMGQVDDVSRCVSMDLKRAGNLLYLVGQTRDELGGSHLSLVTDRQGGHVPKVDAPRARETFLAMHDSIQAGHVVACHDLSEGGLAVAAAEMALAGGLGARLSLDAVPHNIAERSSEALTVTLTFSESNTRFLCEVPREQQAAFEEKLQAADVSFGCLGHVTQSSRLQITTEEAQQEAYPESTPWLIDAPLETLKEAWQAPLRW
jgi:phosphoribosylformylglycinamidine synthase